MLTNLLVASFSKNLAADMQGSIFTPYSSFDTWPRLLRVIGGFSYARVTADRLEEPKWRNLSMFCLSDGLSGELVQCGMNLLEPTWTLPLT
jgi:hypothetical protein